MLALQHKSARLKQPKQVNHVIIKTITRGVSSKISIQILSSQTDFHVGDQTSPACFPVVLL